MQLQNASTGGGLGYGAIVPLASNVTWAYPFLPGEPPNVLRYNFSACIPSNITIARTCCAAANGTFVTQTLSNEHQVNQTELLAIWNAKYPGRNMSSHATDYYISGDLTPTPNVTDSTGSFHWCSTSYLPLTSTPLTGAGWTSSGIASNVPQSMQTWMDCFNANIPADAINKTEAAYVCAAVNVLDGGVIHGYKTYAQTGSTGGAGRSANLRNGAMVILGCSWSLLVIISKI